MTSSFAAYASQYLNRQQHGAASALSSSTSNPMFFSFSTDDGSRAGHSTDADLDDQGDPHLRVSSQRIDEDDEDEDDPYLRLDEDGSMHPNSQSIPLIASDHSHRGGGSVSSVGSPKGWLAHLAASPSPMPLLRGAPRSPSPSGSDSSDSGPPPDLFAPSPRQQTHQQHAHPTQHQQRPHQAYPTPPPPRTYQHQHHQQPQSLSLTESLLPRDGFSRPLDVFSLPDPRHVPLSRRKYHDSIWTALWLTGVSICLFSSFLSLFLTHKPKGADKPQRRPVILPYTTLLHTIPLITILTFVSAAVAYTHIWLLRVFVKPVMIATEVFVPATLFISAVWAFVGSFMWDADTEPTWGETVGLRLFSLVPLVLCVLTARRLLHLPRQLHLTSSLLTLTTHLLQQHPFLLALSPAILLLSLLGSLPFFTLIFRLLLVGYADSERQWHLNAWVNWAILGSVGVWLWSWGVARGVMRVAAAGVIGAWYFADPDTPPPSPTSTHTIHAALTRAVTSSLGTTALSALILTLIRLLTLLTIFLNRLPLYLPLRVAAVLVPTLRLVVGYLDNATTALSKYALVYAGLTGDAFMASARRSRALTASVEAKGKAGRRRGNGVRGEPPLTLLTIAPLTLTFPFALLTYLFVAHTLGAPNSALGAAVLAAGVTALVGMFCVGLVKDTADTLYICYCIDKDIGQRGREEVFIAFEYDAPAPVPQQQQQQSRQRRAGQPEHIVPRPATYQQPSSQQQQHQRNSSYPQQRHQDQNIADALASVITPTQQPQRGPLLPRPSGGMDLPQSPPRRNVPLSPSRRAAPLPQQPRVAQMQQPQPLPAPSAGSNLMEEVDVDPFQQSFSSDAPPSAFLQERGVVKDGSDSSDEEGGDGSQFFPGSGFF